MDGFKTLISVIEEEKSHEAGNCWIPALTAIGNLLEALSDQTDPRTLRFASQTEDLGLRFEKLFASLVSHSSGHEHHALQEELERLLKLLNGNGNISSFAREETAT